MATATEVLDPPVRPSGRVGTWLPPLLLVVASVLARVPALVNARGVNSDAAVVGLQAIHVLHGEWSWFLWGAGYQASLDAALVAAAFSVTGPSALTLMVVPLIGYLVAVVLTYDVLRRAVGRGGAAVACLPLVFAPQSINGVALYAPRQWAITTTVLAVWLASRARGRRAPLWLAGSGFAAGFAVYLDLFTLQMMPAVGGFALWCAVTATRSGPGVPRQRARGVGALLLGLVAGVAVIAWSRAQPVADGAKAGLTLDKIGTNWSLMVDQCLPYLLGLRVFVQDPATLEHHLWPAPWPLQVIQAAAACTFAVAVCWAAVAVVGRIGPVAVRGLGALGLIGTAASVGGFLVSTMPADLLSARYLAPIVWLAPFTLAPAAHALGARWFAVGIAPLVVAIGVGGWYAYAPYVHDGIPVRDPRGVAQDEVVLADALRAQGIHHAAAQYWLAYRLTFLFDEDPVVVPLAVADDRYRPYRDGFDAAPVVAYVFHPSEPRATPEAVETQLAAEGATYRREEIAGFTVLVVRR
ncbi:MAG: glycosyltransferase family 39 protein [Pseudonocardia sp.]|nr:glycosyltransferase family 39 protein [Pseudonocardia sp.]